MNPLLLAPAVALGALLGLLAPAAPAAAQTAKIKMGGSLSPPSLDAFTPYAARELGLFKKYGLEVEILEFRGGSTHVKALLSGEVDVAGELGATDTILAASRGAKVRVFMVPQPVTPYHFVARREAATTLQGLAGRSVAVSGIGAISYHIPRIVLDRSGVDPDAPRYVAVGSPADRFKALLAGKIDATVVTNTEAAKLGGYPEIVTLAQVAKILPEVPYNFAVARSEYIEKNPETMAKLTRAMVEANRWMAANRAGTAEMAARVSRGETAEVFAHAFDLADPRLWGVNGDVTEAAHKYTLELLLRIGYLKEPVSLEALFDRRFLDQALKDLGRL
ncbi:MAG TPA: ABC transporter substrate-binding protein [Candidatus Sulfotelmatobacter sp.]|nr:ABC transporter substrate-binding protein [Candidatus Sulfotelmatobacter sp.]